MVELLKITWEALTFNKWTGLGPLQLPFDFLGFPASLVQWLIPSKQKFQPIFPGPEVEEKRGPQNGVLDYP